VRIDILAISQMFSVSFDNIRAMAVSSLSPSAHAAFPPLNSSEALHDSVDSISIRTPCSYICIVVFEDGPCPRP